MKMSKTIEAYLLCGLAILFYPIIRLFMKGTNK